MKRRLPAGLDLLCKAVFGFVVIVAVFALCVVTDDFFGVTRMATAADQPAVAEAVPTLIDVGSADGKYLVTVKNGIVTVTAIKVVTVGTPGIPDDPPPVDPPADLAKAFADAIAKVKEADKKQTAANLKAIVDGALTPAINGKLTDVADVKANLPMVLTLMTMTKPDWSEFSTLIKSSISKVATISELVSVLQPASDELGKVK